MKDKEYLLKIIDMYPNPFDDLIYKSFLYSSSIDELKIWIELTEKNFIDDLISILYDNKIDDTQKLIIIDLMIYLKYQLEYSLELGYKLDDRENNNYRIATQKKNKKKPIISPLTVQVVLSKLVELLNIDRDINIELLQLLVYKESLPRFEKGIRKKQEQIENYLKKSLK